MKVVAILIALSFLNASCTTIKEDKSGSSQIKKMQVNLDKFKNLVSSQKNHNLDDPKTLEYDQKRKVRRDIVRKAVSSKGKKNKELKNTQGKKKLRKTVEKNNKKTALIRKWQKKKRGSKGKSKAKGKKG